MQPVEPLRPQVEPPRASREEWLRAHALSVACCALGAIALVLTTGVHLSTGAAFFSDLPELWLTVPLLLATLGLATGALVRRERGLKFWAVGITCAASAVVLGWVVAAAVIVILTVLAIQVLSDAL